MRNPRHKAFFKQTTAQPAAWAGAALGENGENGVMYYLADATATFFKMMEPVETITF